MSQDTKDSCAQRQEAEVELLLAMYPDQIDWNPAQQQLRYTSDNGAVLCLRLPALYPELEGPLLISALDCNKNDLRNKTRLILEPLLTLRNEELLDGVVQAFEDLVQNIQTSSVHEPTISATASQEKRNALRYKTVIIWLHHLLNTNKRKLALNPSMHESQIIAGVTKPGYPGILLYSGPSHAIDAHVADLKSQRWQAFQVRFTEEINIPWSFREHKIVEVESISEAAQAISDESNRETFLKAIKVK